MSILGQRPRPVASVTPAEDAGAMLVPFDDDAPSVLPLWLCELAELLGVALRKLWLYVCAPMGAMCLLVLLCTCGINRP